MKKRLTVVVCDNCGMEIPDGTGAVMRLNWSDRRKGRIVGDYCDNCGKDVAGQTQKAHGRKTAVEVS